MSLKIKSNLKKNVIQRNKGLLYLELNEYVFQPMNSLLDLKLDIKLKIVTMLEKRMFH